VRGTSERSRMRAAGKFQVARGTLFAAALVTAGTGTTTAQAHLQCVPYVRQVSGSAIYGNAPTSWDQASGKYARGSQPIIGSVLAFQPTHAMPLGTSPSGADQHARVTHVTIIAAYLTQSHALRKPPANPKFFSGCVTKLQTTVLTACGLQPIGLQDMRFTTSSHRRVLLCGTIIASAFAASAASAQNVPQTLAREIRAMATLTALDAASTEDFDTLARWGTSSALPPGWLISESGTGAAASRLYDGLKGAQLLVGGDGEDGIPTR